MGIVGDGIRSVAKKVDPSPSETMVSITQQGRERAGHDTGKTQLGLILNHLLEYSPQSLAEIANSCEMGIKVVKRNLESFPHYFEVRVR